MIETIVYFQHPLKVNSSLTIILNDRGGEDNRQYLRGCQGAGFLTEKSKVEVFFQRLKSANHIGTAAAFILLNGCVIAVLAFVALHTMSGTITMSPWVALTGLLALTFTGAFVAEKKYRQDQKIAEMSKTLEGAHHELQTRISERDKLFHELRKSERDHRAVINSVSDVIFETDENGRIVFVNETWKRLTGRETKETHGKLLFSMLEAGERTRQREMFEQFVRGERQAYRSEARLDMGHNLFRSVELTFSMMRMTEDKSVRIVGTMTDIEQRHRAEMALREAEQRYRTIFENSISGIYQSLPEGRYISVNPALAEILGYASPEDLIERVMDIDHQIYVHPESRREFTQKLLFEGRLSGVESEVFRKDGTKIWIMENARVVRSDKGGVEYYEGSVWDITENKAAEEAMRNARIQAEISSRSRMEFLANMSHELRTPLNAVIGFSEIIKNEVMGPLGSPSYKEYAQDIYESGSQLLKIITEILEVSKIETGNRELRITSMKVTPAIRSCLSIMAPRIEQSGVEVTMNLPESLPDLLAEELGFKQIMLNLVGNAIKFTEKGGKVIVSARMENDGSMVIDVTDTGIGMTEEEVKKAMQPFSKVDMSFSGMKAGTGLGLTIVDSLVRLHGGQFRLISQKGEGTIARIVMPASHVLQKNVTPFKAVK